MFIVISAVISSSSQAGVQLVGLKLPPFKSQPSNMSVQIPSVAPAAPSNKNAPSEPAG
jgi:hypothetical protein